MPLKARRAEACSGDTAALSAHPATDKATRLISNTQTHGQSASRSAARGSSSFRRAKAIIGMGKRGTMQPEWRRHDKLFFLQPAKVRFPFSPWRTLAEATVRWMLLYLRQLPRVTALAVEPRVGFLVSGESPFLWVPAQFAVIPVSEVPQVTDSDSARADFDVSDGLLARANAIDPIAVVALGAPDVKISFADWFLDDAFWLAGQHAAIDAEFAKRAFGDAAAGTAMTHLHAVRVNVAYAGRGFRIVGRNDFDLA